MARPSSSASTGWDGIEAFDVSGGGAQAISGDALDFVRAGTGRGDPAALGLDETVNIYR